MKVNAVEELAGLYAQKGDGLFAEIEATYKAMVEFAGERFFVDGQGGTVLLEYEPTTRNETKLPGPVWDYFASNQEMVNGADFLSEVTQEYVGDDEDGDAIYGEDVLELSQDLAEVLLVMRGDLQL